MMTAEQVNELCDKIIKTELMRLDGPWAATVAAVLFAKVIKGNGISADRATYMIRQALIQTKRPDQMIILPEGFH